MSTKKTSGILVASKHKSEFSPMMRSTRKGNEFYLKSVYAANTKKYRVYLQLDSFN